ncbi:MAG: hypothetical protein IT204_15830 [Fimbriimonadaceae bacterium]|nr:hypothetical protein [Fimbriimonadaceae bacterium]
MFASGWFVCLLTLAPAAPTSGTVVLRESFDGPLPADWTVTAGQWTVRDGRLHGQATAYLSRVLCPTAALSDVAVEVDAAFASVKNSSRWLALVTRQASGQFAPFTCFTHRFDRTAPNGLEFSQGAGPGPSVQWRIIATGAAAVPPVLDQPHRLRVELRERWAWGWLDGNLVLQARLPEAQSGLVGLVVSDCSAWFDNLLVEALPPLSGDELAALEQRQEGSGLPLVVAHRGNSAHAPENTLAAIDEAFRAGADVVEIDLRRTADGHLVLFHDNTLERTAGGQGKPEDHPLAELQQLDAGTWKSDRYRGERIPTFVAALDRLPPQGQYLLDLKATGLGPLIAPLLRERGLTDRVILGPWQPPEAAALRALLPDTPTVLIGSAPGVLAADYFAGLLAQGVRGFNYAAGSLTPEFVRAATRRGLPVFAWTVNDPAAMVHLARLGVTGILTDDPALLRQTLDAERRRTTP